jgi:uncharacterized peroxidase-related enzyme
VHHGDALTRESGDALLAEAVAFARFDTLPQRLRALCEYAVRLTTAPAAMNEGDIEALRTDGFDDRTIVDANQVVAYFNYVNRIALGLGVDLEESWSEAARARQHYPLSRRR